MNHHMNRKRTIMLDTTRSSSFPVAQNMSSDQPHPLQDTWSASLPGSIFSSTPCLPDATCRCKISILFVSHLSYQYLYLCICIYNHVCIHRYIAIYQCNLEMKTLLPPRSQEVRKSFVYFSDKWNHQNIKADHLTSSSWIFTCGNSSFNTLFSHPYLPLFPYVLSKLGSCCARNPLSHRLMICLRPSCISEPGPKQIWFRQSPRTFPGVEAECAGWFLPKD